MLTAGWTRTTGHEDCERRLRYRRLRVTDPRCAAPCAFSATDERRADRSVRDPRAPRSVGSSVAARVPKAVFCLAHGVAHAPLRVSEISTASGSNAQMALLHGPVEGLVRYARECCRFTASQEWAGDDGGGGVHGGVGGPVGRGSWRRGGVGRRSFVAGVSAAVVQARIGRAADVWIVMDYHGPS